MRSLITMINENDRIDAIKRSGTKESINVGLYVEGKKISNTIIQFFKRVLQKFELINYFFSILAVRKAINK